MQARERDAMPVLRNDCNAMVDPRALQVAAVIIATLESSELVAGKVNPAPEDNVGHPSSTKAQGRDTQKAGLALR